MQEGLTHFDPSGNAIMVDVSEKEITARCAVASGTIAVNAAVMDAIVNKTAKKGDVLATLYTNKAASLAESEAMFLRALSWSEEKPEPETLIFDIIR